MVVGTLTSLSLCFWNWGLDEKMVVESGVCVCEIVFFVVLGFLCFFLCVLWGFGR